MIRAWLTARQQLDAFLAKYDAPVAAQARAAIAALRARLPGAVQLVYDNYNALVVGFGPSERASEAVFSIAVYPRWVTLFFLKGAGLPDPKRLLKGSGRIVRHIVLQTPQVLDEPAVRALMVAALARASPPIVAAPPGRLVIRSVSATQRPRRAASPASRESGPRKAVPRKRASRARKPGR